MNADRFQSLVRQLYELVGEFERMFPKRKFTPDGHLFGSIGESIAEYYYGLEVLRHSTKHVDALTPDGVCVQVKATQKHKGGSVDVNPESLENILLVLRVLPTGVFEEIYNGPGRHVKPLTEVLTRRKDGAYSISITKLEKAHELVAPSDRLRRVQT